MASNSQASALPSRDPAAAPTIQDAAKVVGWGLLFWGAAQFAAVPFARSAIALVAVQALLAEWCAGRLGIPWSDPLAPMPSWQKVAKRAARGAAAGAGAAIAMLLLVHFSLRAGDLPEGALAATALLVGLVVALLKAARDELLLRGVLLRATRGTLPSWVSLLALGAAAAAARYGEGGAVGLGLAVEAMRGLALGALWLRDRGAWMAVAANAAWTFTLSSGGIVDLRLLAGGDAAVVGLTVTTSAAIAAVLWARRGV
jgi:hypothetical protein